MSERAYPNPFATKSTPRYNAPMSEGFPSEADTILTGIEAARRAVEGTPELQQRITGREAREAHVRAALRPETFRDGNTTPEWAAERIIDVGLPVDRIKAITLERNKKGRETVLGSWGIGEKNKGVYSVYELLQRQIPEKQLGTIAHESGHANSPFRNENAFLFGSEEARAEAARFAEAAAQQTIDSQRFLNNYHKDLYARMIAGDITRATFNEETWAITTELALTNRKHLQQVQEAQHASIDRRMKSKLVAEDYKKVTLISGANVAGVDKALIALLDGVEDLDGLVAHVDGLKAKFYPQTSLAMAA